MYEKYYVLFVDDDVNILSSLRRGMMEENFICKFAGSAKEALSIIEKEKISAIVTDMRMPEMNGLELLKLVEEKSPMTVKLVLSGYTQIPQILATVNQVDIFKFIGKPWELDDLIIMIRKALDYYIIKEENANQKIVLETQNKAYQNILKKTSAVVANAKKSNEVLGICGRTILDFGNDFSAEDREKYFSVFKAKGTIFEILSKAVLSEKKNISVKSIAETVSSAISSLFNDTKTEIKGDMNCEINTDLEICEASVLVCGTIFFEEFKNYGLLASVENSSQFKFVLICPGAGKSEKSLLDVKISFCEKVLGATLPMYGISFKIAVINDSLIAGFSIGDSNTAIE